MIYTTKTKLKNNYVVISVFRNLEFWHEYDFRVEKIDYFLKHISYKRWGTIQNLEEIKNCVYGKR